MGCSQGKPIPQSDILNSPLEDAIAELSIVPPPQLRDNIDHKEASTEVLAIQEPSRELFACHRWYPTNKCIPCLEERPFSRKRPSLFDRATHQLLPSSVVIKGKKFFALNDPTGDTLLEVKPSAGFIIKTTRTGDGSKVFINVFTEQSMQQAFVPTLRSKCEDKKGETLDLFMAIVPQSIHGAADAERSKVCRGIIEDVNDIFSESLSSSYVLPVIKRGFMGEEPDHFWVPLSHMSAEERVELRHLQPDILLIVPANSLRVQEIVHVFMYTDPAVDNLFISRGKSARDSGIRRFDLLVPAKFRFADAALHQRLFTKCMEGIRNVFDEELDGQIADALDTTKIDEIETSYAIESSALRENQLADAAEAFPPQENLTSLQGKPAFVLKSSRDDGAKVFINAFTSDHIDKNFVAVSKDVCEDKKGNQCTLFHWLVPVETRMLPESALTVHFESLILKFNTLFNESIRVPITFSYVVKGFMGLDVPEFLVPRSMLVNRESKQCITDASNPADALGAEESFPVERQKAPVNSDLKRISEARCSSFPVAKSPSDDFWEGVLEPLPALPPRTDFSAIVKEKERYVVLELGTLKIYRDKGNSAPFGHGMRGAFNLKDYVLSANQKTNMLGENFLSIHLTSPFDKTLEISVVSSSLERVLESFAEHIRYANENSLETGDGNGIVETPASSASSSEEKSGERSGAPSTASRVSWGEEKSNAESAFTGEKKDEDMEKPSEDGHIAVQLPLVTPTQQQDAKLSLRSSAPEEISDIQPMELRPFSEVFNSSISLASLPDHDHDHDAVYSCSLPSPSESEEKDERVDETVAIPDRLKFWAQKKGHINVALKTRYFVLDHGNLTYFGDSLEESPPYGKDFKGSMALDRCTVSDLVDPTYSSSAAFSIVIQSVDKTRDLHLQINDSSLHGKVHQALRRHAQYADKMIASLMAPPQKLPVPSRRMSRLFSRNMSVDSNPSAFQVPISASDYKPSGRDICEWSVYLRDGEQLVATSLVTKPVPLGRGQPRQLLLTSQRRLVSVDPSTREVASVLDVTLGKALWPIAKVGESKDVLIVKPATGTSEVKFIDSLYGAQFWVDKITSLRSDFL